MALNAILMESITIVDLLLVASLGDVSVAAFGIGGALIAFVISIQFSISNGTQLVLSRAVGAGDKNNLGLEVTCGWILGTGFSFIALIALFLGADPLIRLIAHNENVALQAIDYVRISLLVIFFSSLSKVVVSYFNACKKTRIPLYGFLLEIPINIPGLVCSASSVFLCSHYADTALDKDRLLVRQLVDSIEHYSGQSEAWQKGVQHYPDS